MIIVEFLLQTLEQHGVRFIFGNPGTTELPLVRACERRRGIEYIVALSEVAATPMADGYARATRSLGVLNLHVAPGLGNGMGGLYTARIAQSPLLVLVGGQDRRFLHTEPILWGPVEKMAATVAKAVFTLNSRYDAVFNIRAPFVPPSPCRFHLSRSSVRPTCWLKRSMRASRRSRRRHSRRCRPRRPRSLRACWRAPAVRLS